jgi:hypothetical protein
MTAPPPSLASTSPARLGTGRGRACAAGVVVVAVRGLVEGTDLSQRAVAARVG